LCRAAETVIALAGRLADARRQVQALNDERPDVALTLQIHPALTGASADPHRQGDQLATEALMRLLRARRQLLETDLATLAEDVFGIDVAVVETAEWFDGAAWSEDGVKVAVVGTSRWPGRQRFALAHQLCHLLVDDEPGLHVDASVEQVPPERAHSETRANAVAAAFLMPEEVLRDVAPATWTSSSFAALTTWLRLPARAVAGRLHQLGLMSAADRQRWEEMRGAEVAMLAGATELYAARCRAASRPRLPARLVREAVRADPGAVAPFRC
jgi:Zn-dependent peptidase ImmA (M78 family)